MTSPSMTFNDRDSNTPIMAAWLNGVNNAVYKPSLKTTIGGKAIADFSLDHSTPNSYVMITDTNPLDWAGGPGRMSVTFELISLMRLPALHTVRRTPQPHQTDRQATGGAGHPA